MLTFNELVGAPAKALARPRNLFWDTLFYDVGNLSEGEREELSRAPDKEGAVIAVSPGGSTNGIRHYPSAKAMLTREEKSIAAVAVPGVGSSVVGSASLARTVADALGEDVAAIVCGYGAVDLLQEAMGGWFFYGYTDKFKHQTEALMEKVNLVSPDAAVATGEGLKASTATTRIGLPKQLDTGTLAEILEARPPKLKLLLGHSKGSMLIDFVLEQYVTDQAGMPSDLYEELMVVTVSAVVALPRQFKKCRQVIGALDWFGGLNSVPDLLRSQVDGVKPLTVPGAWHHLNRNYAFRLDLGAALKEVMAET